MAGEHLRSERVPLEKAVNFFFFGSLCVFIGSLWDSRFPINKNLWTSSYVAFTGGVALILLAACCHLVEIKNFTMWTKLFLVLDLNAITVFALSEIVNLTLIYAVVAPANGTAVSLKTFVYKDYFASWAGPLNGSLFYALTYLMVWLGIMTILYKKRIFIEV